MLTCKQNESLQLNQQDTASREQQLQRRPSRISPPNYNANLQQFNSNLKASETSKCPNNNTNNLTNAFSNNANLDTNEIITKLTKNSTKRVKPVKSRLKQPVAVGSMASASYRDSFSSASSKTISNENREISQKSRLAKCLPVGITKTTTLAKARPTSLALKSNVLNVNRETSDISSFVPNFGFNKSSSSTTTIKRSSVGNTKKLKNSSPFTFKTNTTNSCGEHANGSPMTTTQNSNLASTNKCLQPTIAVVHPQYSSSNRVNSSATINKKVSPTTITVNNKSTAATILPTTQQQNQCRTTTKLESKKINLNNNNNHNHKDGEKVKKEERSNEECKQQDGSQIVNRHVKTKSFTSLSISQPNKMRLTTNGAHKNDHFVLNNTSNNYSLSVASSIDHNTTNNDYDDKKQLKSNKQSDLRLASQIRFKQMTIPGSELLQSLEKDQQSNNCYGYDKAKLTNNSTATKYFGSKLKQKNNNNNDDNKDNNDFHILNDRILPKPMAQQVLSLMMLDVGLMPANNNNQQQASRFDESHVTVKSSLDDDINSRTYFVDNVQTDGITTISNHNNDAVNRFKGNNVIDYNSNYKHCNEYNSLQFSSNINQMLQVNLTNQDNENNRSISLPSSPRLNRFKEAQLMQENHLKNTQSFTKRTNGVEFLRLHRHLSARNLIDDYKGKRLLSEPLSKNNNKENFPNDVGRNQHPPFVPDIQDNHSISSSSCSSLNHCPPLLALSTHLDGLRFDELVNSKLDFHGQSNQCDMIKNKNTLSTTNFAKQHENTIGNLESKVEKQVSTKIDLIQSPKKINQFQNILTIENETNNQNSHIKHSPSASRTDYIGPDNNIQADPQFKRQPQLRSNSISGQEFHASGGYHRLKNLLYSNQNTSTIPATYGAHQVHHSQLYNTQANNRMLNLSGSTYQQQHLQQPNHHYIGRSPSPSTSANSQSPSQLLFNQREITSRYSDKPTKNQLHASLECLNSKINYSDYQQQHVHDQASQHHQINQQPTYSINPQHQIQNQHYAASYILAAPPANTIINQNGDQDLAAAAMGAPPPPTPTPCQQQYQHPISASHYNINGTQQQINQQSMINRAMAHVSQSPLRRMGLNQSMLNTSSNISSSALLNHLSSSLHHPMRAGHSSLSLASSSFIVEDKLQNEIRKLHSDLRSEKEKNEALNSQLNINSGLMAAFEQSLTTLNDRLRQLTTLNEKKDYEIQELRQQLNELKNSHTTSDKDKNKPLNLNNTNLQSKDNRNEQSEIFDQKSPMTNYDNNNTSEEDNNSERNKLLKEIEDLKRQLTIKDRLLTDTRLEALSAAHQLEQLEAKLNGEHSSLLNNDDDLDEGVMVINHSPNGSDAVTDSVHFNEINGQTNNRANQQFNTCIDNRSMTPTNIITNIDNNDRDGNGDTANYINNNNDNNQDTNSIEDGSPVNNTNEQHSDHSSEYHLEFGKENDQDNFKSTQQYLDDNNSNSLLMEKLLISS